TAFGYSVEAGEPWIVVTPVRGTITKEERVAVSVDWTRAPVVVGERRVPITVTGPNGAHVVVQALVTNPAWPKRDSVVAFVEGGGFVSMEAEHYSLAVGSGEIGWQR